MSQHDFLTLFAGAALGIFLISPLAAWRIAASLRKTYTMALKDSAGSIETAAQALTTAAEALDTAAGQIAAATDTSVLDQPLADLATGTKAVTDATAKIVAALPAAA